MSDFENWVSKNLPKTPTFHPQTASLKHRSDSSHGQDGSPPTLNSLSLQPLAPLPHPPLIPAGSLLWSKALTMTFTHFPAPSYTQCGLSHSNAVWAFTIQSCVLLFESQCELSHTDAMLASRSNYSESLFLLDAVGALPTQIAVWYLMSLNMGALPFEIQCEPFLPRTFWLEVPESPLPGRDASSHSSGPHIRREWECHVSYFMVSFPTICGCTLWGWLGLFFLT